MSLTTIGSYDDFDILIDQGILDEDDINEFIGTLPSTRTGIDIVVDTETGTLGTVPVIPDISTAGVGTTMGAIVAITVETLPLWGTAIINALQLLGYVVTIEEITEWITGTGGFFNLDDVVQAWISQASGGFIGPPSPRASQGRLPNLQELGFTDSNGAAIGVVGTVKHGFTIKQIDVWSRGQRQSKLVWHKLKRTQTPAERMATAQGRREQKVSDSKYWGKKNTASYKRGLAHGKENMRKEMLMYGRGNVYQTGG